MKLREQLPLSPAGGGFSPVGLLLSAGPVGAAILLSHCKIYPGLTQWMKAVCVLHINFEAKNHILLKSLLFIFTFVVFWRNEVRCVSHVEGFRCPEKISLELYQGCQHKQELRRSMIFCASAPATNRKCALRWDSHRNHWDCSK